MIIYIYTLVMMVAGYYGLYLGTESNPFHLFVFMNFLYLIIMCLGITGTIIMALNDADKLVEIWSKRSMWKRISGWIITTTQVALIIWLALEACYVSAFLLLLSKLIDEIIVLIFKSACTAIRNAKK